MSRYYRSDRGSRQEIRFRDVDTNTELLEGELFLADGKLVVRLDGQNWVLAPYDFVGNQGPQGYQGPQGITGAQGHQGNDGPVGPQGFQGSVGPQGAQGQVGAQGDQGSTGAQGPQGYQGAKGEQGFQGAQGDQGFGLQGAQGDQGDVGPQGDVGAQGSTGQQGAQGQQGPTGYQGPQGEKGYQGDQGPTGATGSKGDQGDQGPTGATGSQGSTGAQGPQGTQGVQGFQGDTGTQGDQGPQGFQGAKGDQGDVGATGSQGPQGTQGVQGAKGDQGDQGTQGVQGAIGSQGSTGAQGATGSQGDQGSTGAQGPQGTQGVQGTQGTQGVQGAQGATGSSNAFFNYQAKTSITSGDPLSGHITWNNATQTSATEIFVSDTDQNISNIDIFLSNLPIGSVIRIQDASSHLNYQEWEITTKTDNSTYWTYGVTYIGGGYTFTNNYQILLIVASYPEGPQGPQGTQGSIGAQGVQGATGSQGATGDQGPQGTQGDQGATGSQGSTGAQGPQGDQGTTGSTGATGSQGPQGTQGVQGPGQSLLYVEEFRNTTTPNATVPIHGVQAFGSETNIDYRIGAKGSGAIVAQIADNTTTGGNKRGTNAVDLQKTRSVNTQVASGDSAVITGGKNNTAGGTSNAVVAGNDNATTGTSSVIVGGMFNSIDTSVSGAGILAGKDALATNTGTYQAGGRFTLQGDAQSAQFVLKARTTNSTATELLTWGDGDANTDVTSGTKRIILKDRQSMMIEANIMGVNEADQSKIASYKIQAVARRTTSAANTFIDYKNIITLHEAVDANWNVDLEADTTNGALKFTATGETSKNIRWVGNIKTVEIVIPVGGGGGFDTDAQAFFDATGISDSSQKTAINNLVVGLKDDGLWTKLKAVYPMVGGTATTHKFNLKDAQDTNAAFRLEFNGTWTHSSTGAKADGSTGWANTFVVPNTDLNLNEGFIGYYSRNNVEGTQDVEMGVADGSSSLFLAIQWTAAEGNFRAFNASQLGGTANPNSKAGWWMLHRNSSSQIETTRNNTVIYTDTSNASGLSLNKIYLGAYNSGGAGTFSTPRECAFAVIGHLGLTSGEKASLYTRIQDFQTALGRQV